MRFWLSLIAMPLLLAGCATGYYQGPPSDHFDGKKFYYPGERNLPKSNIQDLYNLLIEIIQHPWSKRLPPIHYSQLPSYPSQTKITFINHSSVLIQNHQVNFLLDPVYSYRVSPFQFLGPARVHEPGVRFADLPNIDAVLISHNHYDHMDLATLKTLDKTFHPVFIVPLGNKVLLNQYGIFNVIELDWWQKYKIKNATVTFLPAHHSAQRWLHDYNWTLWGSYGLEVDHKKLYFAGDTSYTKHFKLIRKKWGRPDFSFIPIGAYKPRRLLWRDHVDPQEAVYAHLDLGSDTSLGIHWGTFQLSEEDIDQPPKDLAIARKKSHVADDKFFVIREGQPFFVTRLPASS